MAGVITEHDPGIMDCGHHTSNKDLRLESQTYFCRLCELQERCRDAETHEIELTLERGKLRDGLRSWLKDSRACAAIADDCTNRYSCKCLYCGTIDLLK